MRVKPGSQQEQVDVVIVGAGAAGSLYAARFATAGKSVQVLEAGPAWSTRDLASSQIWARRLKWGGWPTMPGGDHPFGYNMSHGWGLGGAALHHYAGWPRLHPEDFRTRSLYGRARDWAVDYDELRPHYDRIQEEMVLSGDAAAEVWRPPGAAYPQPPLPAFKQAKILARGFERLGLRTAPAPLAILSRPVGQRAACIFDGWCDAGCPIGALANPLVTHIPVAQQAGVRFLTGAVATRVLIDTRGRAIGVAYRTHDGTAHSIYARLIVLAASAVQNVRLLFNSANERFPHGIGNRTGQLGQGFTCHTIPAVYGLFDEPLDNHLGVTAGQLICQDGYRKNGRDGAFGSYQWGIAPALKPNDLLGVANTRPDLFGTKLVDFLTHSSHSIASMSAVCETLPHPQRRIELDSRRDAFGLPLARIVNSLDRDAIALHEYATQEGLRIMKAAGAREAWHGVLSTSHALGGTVMGDDPGDSVCDSHGITHEVPNLVLAGGGLFATSGGGSPTFTLYALSDRSAAHILANWSSLAG